MLNNNEIDYLRYTKEYQDDEDKDDYLKLREDHLNWVFESGREALRDMYLYINDRVILGNEQFLMGWKEEMEQFICEVKQYITSQI